MDRSRKSPSCARLLREARRRHRLGQRDLAERAGTTQTQISRIERDLISPSVSTLERLLQAIGETVTVSSLPLDQPPPGGGNVAIRELRSDYESLTPEERLQQAAELSEIQTELAANRPRS
jgi:transcriptional regulator with XRE-family HTH domain